MTEMSKCSRLSLHDQDKKATGIFFHLSPPYFNFSKRGCYKDSFGMYSLSFVIASNPQIVFSEGNYLFHEESFPVHNCEMSAVFAMVVGVIIFLFQGRIVFCSSLSTEAAKPTTKAEGVGSILCLK